MPSIPILKSLHRQRTWSYQAPYQCTDNEVDWDLFLLEDPEYAHVRKPARPTTAKNNRDLMTCPRNRYQSLCESWRFSQGVCVRLVAMQA